MKIAYNSVNYGAHVNNGKVEYYKEYSINGRIVYIVGITYRAYIDAVTNI